MEAFTAKRRNVARKSTSNRPLRPFKNTLTSDYVSDKLNTTISDSLEDRLHIQVFAKNDEKTTKYWANGLSNNLYRDELEASDKCDLLLEIPEDGEGIFTLSDNMFKFYKESMLSPKTNFDSSFDPIDLDRVLNYPTQRKHDIQYSEPTQLYSPVNDISDQCKGTSNVKRRLSSEMTGFELPSKCRKNSKYSEKSNVYKHVISDEDAIYAHEESVLYDAKIEDILNTDNVVEKLKNSSEGSCDDKLDTKNVEKLNNIFDGSCDIEKINNVSSIDEETDNNKCTLKVEYALTLGDGEFDMWEEEPCEQELETKVVELSPVKKKCTQNRKRNRLSLKSKKKSKKRTKTESCKGDILNSDNEVSVNKELIEIDNNNKTDESKHDTLFVELNETEMKNDSVSLTIETDIGRNDGVSDSPPADQVITEKQVENVAINDNSLGLSADDKNVPVRLSNKISCVSDSCETIKPLETDCNKPLQSSPNKKSVTNEKKCKSEINEGVLLHLEASKKTNIMKDGRILKDKKDLLKDIESKIEENIPIEVVDIDIQQSLTEQILLDQVRRLSHQRTSPRRRGLSQSDETALIKLIKTANKRNTRSALANKNKKSDLPVDDTQNTIISNSLQVGLPSEIPDIDNDQSNIKTTMEKNQNAKVTKGKKENKAIDMQNLSQAFEEIINDTTILQSRIASQVNGNSRITSKNSKKKKSPYSKKKKKSPKSKKKKKSDLASTSMNENQEVMTVGIKLSNTLPQTSEMPACSEQTVPIILIKKCKLPLNDNSGISPNKVFISNGEGLTNSEGNITVGEDSNQIDVDNETWTITTPKVVSDSFETNQNEDNSKPVSPSGGNNTLDSQEQPDTCNLLDNSAFSDCSLVIDEDRSNAMEVDSPSSPDAEVIDSPKKAVAMEVDSPTSPDAEVIDSPKKTGAIEVDSPSSPDAEVIDSLQKNVSKEQTAGTFIPFLDEPQNAFIPAPDKPLSESLEAIMRSSSDSILPVTSPNNSVQEFNRHSTSNNSSPSFRSETVSQTSQVDISTPNSDYYNPCHSPVLVRPGSSSILQLTKPHFTLTESQPVYTYPMPKSTFTTNSSTPAGTRCHQPETITSGDAAYNEINSSLPFPTYSCTSRNSDIAQTLPYTTSNSVELNEVPQSSNTNAVINSAAVNKPCLTSDYVPQNITVAKACHEENIERKIKQVSTVNNDIRAASTEQKQRVKDIPLAIVQRDPRLRNRKMRVLLINDDLPGTDLSEIKLNINRSPETVGEKDKPVADECHPSPSESKNDSNNLEINGGTQRKKSKKKEIDEELLYRTPLSDLHDVPERSSYSRSIPKKSKLESKKDAHLHRMIEDDRIGVHPQEQCDPYTESNWNVNNDYGINHPEVGWQNPNFSELREDNGLCQANNGDNLYPQMYSTDNLQRQHFIEHQGNLVMPNYINQEPYSDGYGPPPGDFSQDFGNIHHHQKDKGNSSFNTNYASWDYAHQKLENGFIVEDNSSKSDFVVESNWEDENKVRDFRPKPLLNNPPYSRRKPWKGGHYRGDDSNSRGGELFERRNPSKGSGPRRSSNDWEYYNDIVNGPIRRESDDRRYHRNFRGSRGRGDWSSRRDYEMYGKKCPRSPR